MRKLLFVLLIFFVCQGLAWAQNLDSAEQPNLCDGTWVVQKQQTGKWVVTRIEDKLTKPVLPGTLILNCGAESDFLQDYMDGVKAIVQCSEPNQMGEYHVQQLQIICE